MNGIERFFLAKPSESAKTPLETEEVLRRARLVMYAGLGLGILLTAFCILVLLKSEASRFDWRIGLICSVSVLTLGSVFRLRKGNDSYKGIAVLLLFLILTVVPVRIMQTGGVYSASNGLIPVSIFFAANIFGKNIAWFVGAFWLCETAFMGFAQSMGWVTMVSPDAILFSALTVCICTLLFGVMLGSFLKAQDQHKDKILDIERQRVMGLMVAALSHEVNNPLFILRLLCRKGIDAGSIDGLGLEKLDKHLLRIEMVIKSISEIGKGHTKFEVVTYEGETKMLQLSQPGLEESEFEKTRKAS